MGNKQTERVAEGGKTMTSIDWFNKQIVNKQNGEGDLRSWDMIFQQAKEKHKQEIIDAWIATDNVLQREMAEQYYNETYGKE